MLRKKMVFKVVVFVLLVAFATSGSYAASTPTTTNLPDKFKISGYVCPEFMCPGGIVKPSSAGTIPPEVKSKLLSGFKVELTWNAMPDYYQSVLTDENGYFEFTDVMKTSTPGIPSATAPYKFVISKKGYLTRIIENVTVPSCDILLSTADQPLIMMVGDMNNDGAINMTDIMKIVASFNSVKGDAKYSETVDFNQDGAVNMTDIMTAMRCFNSVCPDYPPVKPIRVAPTPTPIVNTPTPLITTPSPMVTPTATLVTGEKEWAANTTYSPGDIVIYTGKKYQCIQPHTSLPGWTPSSVASLWQEI